MNVEEEIKNLENIVQDNIDLLTDKISNYNKKLKEFNIDGKQYSKLSYKKFTFNYKIILSSFLILYTGIYFILSKTQPNFVCNKVKNEKTYFIENRICILKLISFSFIFSICSLLIFYFLYYFYNMTRN
jgi:hypothetical protein